MQLEVKDTMAPDLVKAIEQGLNDHTLEHGAAPFVKVALSVCYRSAEGLVLGGLTGDTNWNVLCIDMLWVGVVQRGKGLARALIAEAEAEAVRRGCHTSYLWTHSWQGENFYPKLGYESFVVWDNVPTGFRRTGFMKRLAI